MLNILDEEDRAMLILKYAENYSYEELSEIFGLSVSACKMRISRACDKIQSRFGKQVSSIDGERLVRATGRLPVPPVPPTFDRAVHERINKRLVVGQFLDFATRGFAFAMVHFARAVAELLQSERDGEVRVGISGGFSAGAMNCTP